MPNEMWYESESGRSGVWKQHGNSNACDATWAHPTAGRVIYMSVDTKSPEELEP